MPDFLPVVAGAALLVALVLGMILFFASRYRRCPANKLLVISGKVGGGNAAKTISGGGAFVWPVIQEFAYLDLVPIQINIPLRDALSFENIRVAVPSVFTVAIGTDHELQQNAAVRLLGLTHDEIVKTAQDIIFGQLRQVIASMTIEQINRDRDAFLHKIQNSLEPELKKVGLVLINVNITDLKDDSGYIEAIGRKAASQAVQQARGDVAEQEKLGEIRVAENEREKAVQVATAAKDREIALRENVREQAVRVAELEREQRIGEQTAAFQAEAHIKEAEQLKRVAVAQAEAKAIAGEAESQAQVVATQATLQVKKAEAYQTAETRKREAEAAVQEAQNRALAKAALAEADRVEAEKRAALEAPAKAEKAKKIVEAEAEAERVRIAAEAEARATYARLEAQARGEYEILAKKAEAMGQMVEQAGGAREAFMLQMVEQMPLLMDSAAKAISNIKLDKVVVWEGGNGSLNGVGGTAGFVQGLTRAMPPMMQVLRDVAGVDLPAFMGTMTPETPAPTVSAAPAAANGGETPAKGDDPVAPLVESVRRN
ncbi:MAG TPA: SPFH domain-containing protein [Gemmatimonadales bacterium]|nr:SPFH domain-containing protein [Gemmatimonadales bacterium]